MCRDNNHGGRRCPHDTSAARRLRRHRAHLEASLTDQLHRPPVGLTLTADTSTVVIEPSAPEAVSRANIQHLRTYIHDLERQYWRIFNDPFSVSDTSPCVVDGQRYSDSVQALDAITIAQEKATVAAGDAVVAIALAENNVQEGAVQTLLLNRLTALDGELDVLFATEPRDVGRIEAVKSESRALLQQEGIAHPEVGKIMADHAAAYMRVLQDVRPFGNARQQLQPGTDRTKIDTLNAATANYPDAWVQASNERPDMIVIHEPERAKYTDNAQVTADMQRKGSREVVFSELAIGGKSEGFADAGMSDAVHEYAHRMEHTGPSLIARMEAAFITRRTTHDGLQEPLLEIIPGGGEYAYFDQFTSRYMGRKYDRRFNKEILSMGMEAIFTGTQGGLVGAGGSRPDPDMKRFILGLLATA